MRKISQLFLLVSTLLFYSCYSEEECEKENYGYIYFENNCDYDCNIYLDEDAFIVVFPNSKTKEFELKVGKHTFKAVKAPEIYGSPPYIIKDKEGTINPCSKNSFVFP